MSLMAFKRLKNRSNRSVQPEKIEHERLTSLINSMADAVIALDQDLNVVLYNAAALNIFDVNTISQGSSIKKLFKPIDKNNQPVDIAALIHTAVVPTTSRDLRLKYSDDSAINLYLSIAPVHLGYGKTGDRGHVLLLRDITHEKSLEEERDEFISVVSHELRTPIAIAEGNIGNALFVAQKLPEAESILQALKEAHDQVLFLADMINDLATLSRAERGRLQVEIEPIDVNELVSSLSESYKADAEAKGLQLKTSCEPNLPALQSSKLYVREIIQNFVTNAIKYTEEGSISISAKANTQGVLFEVSDTGIGISKSDQERVFDKFFRSEDFRTRKASGTGLGLYVTLKLSRLIHAEISLTSQLNKGSTFTILVPNLK